MAREGKLYLHEVSVRLSDSDLERMRALGEELDVTAVQALRFALKDVARSAVRLEAREWEDGEPCYNARLLRLSERDKAAVERLMTEHHLTEGQAIRFAVRAYAQKYGIQ